MILFESKRIGLYMLIMFFALFSSGLAAGPSTYQIKNANSNLKGSDILGTIRIEFDYYTNSGSWYISGYTYRDPYGEKHVFPGYYGVIIDGVIYVTLTNPTSLSPGDHRIGKISVTSNPPLAGENPDGIKFQPDDPQRYGVKSSYDLEKVN